MKIKEKTILYKDNLPYDVQLCNISHIHPHYHSKDLELIFCLKGHIDLVAGHQNVTINAGEIFSVDYRDIHYIESDADNLTVIFHLDLTNLDIAWEKLAYIFFSCESSHYYPYQEKAMTNVKDIILTLAHFKYCKRPGIISLANSLMDILLKYFNWFNYENQTEEMNEELYDRFYRVFVYCNENYNKKITISQLAEAEHINRNYFSQFISKTVFESFSSMIKYIRCYEAEHLLLTTDKPASEICYDCGFSDGKYFYSAFKEWWQSTPAEHRAKYAKCTKKATEVIYIEDADAQNLLREYITQWHIEKTMLIQY